MQMFAWLELRLGLLLKRKCAKVTYVTPPFPSTFPPPPLPLHLSSATSPLHLSSATSHPTTSPFHPPPPPPLPQSPYLENTSKSATLYKWWVGGGSLRKQMGGAKGPKNLPENRSLAHLIICARFLCVLSGNRGSGNPMELTTATSTRALLKLYFTQNIYSTILMNLSNFIDGLNFIHIYATTVFYAHN